MTSRKTITIAAIVFLILLFSGNAGLVSQTSQAQFKIQIASSPTFVPVEQIQSELSVKEQVVVYFLNGRYKYFIGNFSNRTDAEKAVGDVKVKGAWVVGIPASAKEYSRSKETQPKTEQPAEPKQSQATKPAIEKQSAPKSGQVRVEKVYAVQIQASKVFIAPETFKNRFGLSEEVHFFVKDGWYKYVVGKFPTENDAKTLLNKLAKQGFFITSYSDTVAVAPAKEPEPIQTVNKDTLAADTTAAAIDTTKFSADSLPVKDTVSLRQSEYNKKIGEANAAFEEKRYEQARMLYKDASLLMPDKNYPIDQVYEIDRILKEEKLAPATKKIKYFLFGIIAFVVVMISVLVLTLILRTRRQRLDRQKQRLKEQYQDSITEYLFSEEGGQPESLREADTARKKQILIDEIMQLYANLSGEISNKLRELYLDLGLENESVQKTRSPQWHIRAKGFRELAQMNIQTVNEEIELCLNSTNDILRMEAQLAMIRLNYEDPFSFLDKLEQYFTSWEQLHVYEMIQRYQIAVPDFTRWLTSRNESIIVFAIRMIRAFKQEDAYQQLIPFLQHHNYEIREETFMTLGDLGNVEALALLKDRYGYESQPGKVQILKAIGKIPDESNIEFLRGVLEPSSELRLEAADALARIETFGIKGIETILRRSDEDLQAVARHILDNKISR
jgi:HEAT repeat protein